MADPAEIAVEALRQKALELIDERSVVRRRLLEDAVRDQQVERDINGCMAGALALGHELELPPISQRQKVMGWHNAHTNFLNGRNSIVMSYKDLKSDYGVEEDESDESNSGAESKPDMPRIADIVLDRLKVAGREGAKAAAIRRFILNTYNADIHEKTVGMTLYRLQKDDLVRRDGHTWFLASQDAKNPGAATPGSAKPLP